MGYKQLLKKVPGKGKKEIILFALSTCGWCMKTKELLNSLGFEYEYVDVDLLNKKDKEEIYNEFGTRKLSLSFPKIFISSIIIDGFDEDKIRKALK